MARQIRSRFPRTVANLKAAIRELPHVLIYDNDDLSTPYRLVAAFAQGHLVRYQEPAPKWLKPLLP